MFLAERLPSRVIGNPWQLVFTTERDGFSLNNIYRKVEGLERNSPTLIAIRDTEDCCFGALVSDNPSVSEKFYGTGESFLWRTKPDRQVLTYVIAPSLPGDSNHGVLNILEFMDNIQRKPLMYTCILFLILYSVVSKGIFS